MPRTGWWSLLSRESVDEVSVTIQTLQAGSIVELNDAELLAAFEECSLPDELWDHRAHVRVASMYVSRHSLDEAVERMRSGIKAYQRARNVADGLEQGYHETLTVAFMRLVHAANQQTGPHERSSEFCEAHPELLDKRILRQFYSKEQITTWKAKAEFVESDLAPLPLVEPTTVSVEQTIDASPTVDEVSFLDAELDRFNSQQTGRDDFRPLHLVVRDSDGTVVAGLKSITGWDWLYIQVLWVREDQRRNGHGSQLIHAAEAEARQRGCLGSCLSSYSFQAPEFYERHGYRRFGQIDDYPAGQSMFFFSKRFDSV